jgi:hypothetical protein
MRSLTLHAQSPRMVVRAFGGAPLSALGIQPEKSPGYQMARKNARYGEHRS